MKADPDTQRRLLDLAALDASVAQLAHRRRTLAEHDQITTATSTLAERAEVADQAAEVVAELDQRIRKLEREVDEVTTHASRDRKRMDAGGVPAKELERIGHEITTLAARQSELEDQQLELMEEREQRQGELDAAEAARAETTGELTAAIQRRDAAYVEIDAETAKLAADREALLPAFGADVLALYERIRGRAGSGAARLRGNRCEGCRLELPGSELAVIGKAAADEVVTHEECGRILVRTAESAR